MDEIPIELYLEERRKGIEDRKRVFEFPGILIKKRKCKHIIYS